MGTRTIQLNIPDNVDLKDYDFSMIIASKLYEEAKLSAGQAAKIVGLSKRAFIEILGVIHKAKQMSIIPKVNPLIDKLLLINFRISKNIIREILALNNE